MKDYNDRNFYAEKLRILDIDSLYNETKEIFSYGVNNPDSTLTTKRNLLYVEFLNRGEIMMYYIAQVDLLMN